MCYDLVTTPVPDIQYKKSLPKFCNFFCFEDYLNHHLEKLKSCVQVTSVHRVIIGCSNFIRIYGAELSLKDNTATSGHANAR